MMPTRSVAIALDMVALCDRLKDATAVASPAGPFQMKGRKSSQDLVLSAGGRSLSCNFCPSCADLALASCSSLCAANSAGRTTACVPDLDALVCLSAYLHPHLWVQPSASPVLGGLRYSACKVVFGLDFMYSLTGNLRHMELDG